MSYRILTTEAFENSLNKLDNSIKIKIAKEIEHIKINPYSGKHLGYKFFREKKINNYRIYYLIYDDYVAVFLIEISDKKTPQSIINNIKIKFSYYLNIIKERFKV